MLKSDRKFSKILNPMDVKIDLARKKLSWRPEISLKRGLKMQIGENVFKRSNIHNC